MSPEPLHPPSPSYPTPILDAAIARRQQQDEQQRQATLARVWDWLNEFGATYGIIQAYVFGSVIRPHRFTDRSDVDVAVESIHPELFFQAMAKLSEQVEREVDLVELSKCPFAQRIREQGIPWTPQ
jgi:uncharacterized protein